jgi:hypothetical protein
LANLSCGIYDISHPRTPRFVGGADGFPTGVRAIVPFAGGFIVGGRRAYHNGSFTGFIGVFSPPCESLSQLFVSAPELPRIGGNALSRPRPNPFHGATYFDVRLDAPGSVDLAVYDVAGRKVSDLSGEYTNGPNTVRWEGIDGSGRRVPGGVYFLRMRSARGVSSQKIVLRPN